MFQFFAYPHTNLNQQNLDWIIQKIRGLEEASGTGTTRVLYASAETDFDTAAVNARDTIIIVNDGLVHTFAGETIDASNVLVFTAGTFAGTGVIDATILAPRKRIFADGASFTAAELNNPEGFPEWFGAVANSATADCTAAIQQCVNTFRCTSLAEADYYMTGPVYINTSNRELRGYNATSVRSGTRSGGSRLVSLSAAGTMLIVGDTTLNFNVTTNYVHDLTIMPLIADYTASTGCGVSVKCARNVRVENVTVIDYFTGFKLSSIMDGWFTHCRYINHKPDTSNADCMGFFLAQDLPMASANSSISSVWLRECESNFTGTSSAATHGYGILSTGTTGLADFYVDAMNFVATPNAIRLVGVPTNTIQQNVWIRDCTIDNCVMAVEITGGINAGVVNNWVSCGAYASGSTHRGVYVHENYDAPVIIDANVIKNSDTSTATAYGMRFSNVDSVSGENTLVNFPFPVLIGLGTSGAGSLKGYDLTVHAINNKEQYSGSTNDIIRMLDCTMGTFRATCTGEYGYHSGIFVHSSSSLCVVDGSGIDTTKTNVPVSDNGTPIVTPFVSFGVQNAMVGPFYA